MIPPLNSLHRLVWIALVLHPALVAAGQPDFVLPDLDGREHRLSDYRGKWVLVNYWATWCPPCLEEMPELEIFHDAHKDDDALVLGINMEDISVGRLRAFVEAQFLSYPILRERPAARTAFGPLDAMPTSYLVDPGGEVVAKQVGAVTAEALERFIESRRPDGEESP
ncbi:MAG: TlpA disulfide reductase family protein [Chromatiales bacterium]|jgi:thiol-disulfide isomerase/thioredoxin